MRVQYAERPQVFIALANDAGRHRLCSAVKLHMSDTSTAVGTGRQGRQNRGMVLFADAQQYPADFFTPTRPGAVAGIFLKQPVTYLIGQHYPLQTLKTPLSRQFGQCCW